MLIVFSKNLSNTPTFEPLAYEPDKNLQLQLSGFLNDKVFIEDDDGKLSWLMAVTAALFIIIWWAAVWIAAYLNDAYLIKAL